MKRNLMCITLVVLEACIALTAIISGMIVLIQGPAVIQMPLEWLRGTPFSDYTIPMLLLVIVVGGSSLLAAATVFIRREWSVLLSAAAGLIMVGFEIVELAIIQRYMWLQVLYFVSGIAVFGLATSLWMTEYRGHHTISTTSNHA